VLIAPRKRRKPAWLTGRFYCHRLMVKQVGQEHQKNKLPPYSLRSRLMAWRCNKCRGARTGSRRDFLEQIMTRTRAGRRNADKTKDCRPLRFQNAAGTAASRVRRIMPGVKGGRRQVHGASLAAHVAACARPLNAKDRAAHRNTFDPQRVLLQGLGQRCRHIADLIHRGQIKPSLVR